MTQAAKKPTIKATVADWKVKLRTNPKWAVRGLLAIYKYQTADEKWIGETVKDNGVGFTGADSKFLTSLAKQHNSRGFLTDRQIAALFKLMPKYAKQLLKISKGKQ